MGNITLIVDRAAVFRGLGRLVRSYQEDLFGFVGRSGAGQSVLGYIDRLATALVSGVSKENAGGLLIALFRSMFARVGAGTDVLVTGGQLNWYLYNFDFASAYEANGR